MGLAMCIGNRFTNKVIVGRNRMLLGGAYIVKL